jgi:6-phosphogluconolactonase
MSERLLVYIGNYTRGDDAAIYHGQIDPATGAIRILGSTPCEDAPSYLSLHPSGKYLYAVSETNTHDGGGAISAFSIDADSGDLSFLNLQPTGGSPCHNTVDATGRYVLSANYGGGNIAMHPIQADGSLGEMSDFQQHVGSSIDEQRQQEPHAHSINIDPSNQFAFCADLGLDQVVIYRLDLEQGKLKPHGAGTVTPGSGPRHFAVHPSRQTAYVINEMGNTITAFDWDETAGTLDEIQEITTIPAGYGDTTHTADLHISPDGRTLYGSNRGHDSIAVYAIDEAGRLTATGHQTVPATPSNFVLDPSGTWLYAGGQNTNTVPVFRIGADGGLTATGDVLDTPSPVCLKILSQ